MKKLFFIFILSGCSAQKQANIQNSGTDLGKKDALSAQNIKNQSIKDNLIEPAPALYYSAETAKKAVWEIKNELFIPINKIKLGSETDQSSLYWKMDMQSKVHQINLGSGTGFFISPKHIITNFHVIQNSFDENIKTISIKKIEGESISNNLKLLKISSIYDLALLESAKPVESYLKVEHSGQYSQKEAFLITYIKNSLIKTPIYYFKSLFNEELILFERDSRLGNLKGASGGAVVNSKGNIIGVNHAGSENLSAVISVQALNDFLNDNHRDCSRLSQSECLSKEWDFLDKLSQKEDELAQYIIATGLDHSQWLKKKQILMSLIENKKQLTETETKLTKAVDNFNKSQKEAMRIKLKNIIEEYQLSLAEYNQSVSLFNASL